MRSAFCVLYGYPIVVTDRDVLQHPGLKVQPISRHGYTEYVDQLIIWGYNRHGEHDPKALTERWSRSTHLDDEYIELLLEVECNN